MRRRAGSWRPTSSSTTTTGSSGSVEPMKVLGVSYGYHDSSACLVVDGQVVAATAEERLTRQKHDSNFPAHAIEQVLRAAGLEPGQLDQVVFHEDPHAK